MKYKLGDTVEADITGKWVKGRVTCIILETEMMAITILGYGAPYWQSINSPFVRPCKISHRLYEKTKGRVPRNIKRGI